jgi:hypothetical protein
MLYCVFFMLKVVMQSAFVILSAVLLSAVKLSVVLLKVVVPEEFYINSVVIYV